MISEAIVLALISAFTTLVVGIISNHASLNKQKAEFEKHMQEINALQNQTIAILEVRLDSLTKSVEKHNQVVERVYSLEKSEAVFEQNFKVANHRIDDLEKVVNSNA